MDIHEVRQQLRLKSLYDIPMRVTFYARVSSESDEQLNSLGNQVTYYQDLIRKNAAWTFVPGYIDEGLSGISTRKRENFNRMIEDAGKDRFDLIITKEISRFARNTLDSIQFTRKLLSDGVGVFFQNDNINTLDEDSELRLAIMSSIAQDELRKLSSRIKFGHQQAIKSKVVLGNNRIFGYKKDHKRLVIDEKEAGMVRELFTLYASDAYSLKQIEDIFWEKGYRNLNGKKIAHPTLSGMIANPKYKGYYVGNKVKVIDMFTKKQKFLPEEEWVMFKDETGEIVPAIVSEELWEKANTVLRRRSADVKSRQGICNHENLLTGKLFCTHCGMPYYRKDSVGRDGRKNSRWVCSGKLKNGKDSCPSFPIYENEIKDLLTSLFRQGNLDAEKLIDEYTAIYRELTGSSQLEEKIRQQEAAIELASQKKAKLLEYNVTGQISDADFLSMSKQCSAEIEAAKEALRKLRDKQQTDREFHRHMEEIRRVLTDASRNLSGAIITREFVNSFIRRIDIDPSPAGQPEGTLHLSIQIFTGKQTEGYLQKIRKSYQKLHCPEPEEELEAGEKNEKNESFRTGQMTAPSAPQETNPVTTGPRGHKVRAGFTSKKMIESYESSMK